MWSSVTLGVLIGLLVHFAAMWMYKKKLKIKATEQMAEYIDGELYYIVRESEYRERKMYLYDLDEN